MTRWFDVCHLPSGRGRHARSAPCARLFDIVASSHSHRLIRLSHASKVAEAWTATEWRKRSRALESVSRLDDARRPLVEDCPKGLDEE
jgi:hypothetical protein